MKRMDSSGDKVTFAVRVAFPEERVADVLHLLEAYGTEPCEREQLRITPRRRDLASAVASGLLLRRRESGLL